LNGLDKQQKRLEALLEFVKTTDLEGIHWERSGERVAFTRMPGTSLPHHSLTVHPKKGIQETAAPTASIPAAATAASKRILSPMVGTFYRSQRSDGPPLVMEGTVVEPADHVGMIEAMKVRRDVSARVSGKIVKILVEDGHPVEYGQPLFELE